MKHVVNLKSLAAHAQRKFSVYERRARMLRLQVDDVNRKLDKHQIEAELSHLVLNIQSYWSNWSRSLYMSSCLGSSSMAGVWISSTIPLRNEHEALTVAITGRLGVPVPAVWATWKEPQWFSSPDLARIITSAGVSTAPAITQILNSAPVSFSHLRTMRNYLAHRSIGLKREALLIGPHYLKGGAVCASDILLFVEPNRSLSVLERWTYDFRRVAAALCS